MSKELENLFFYDVKLDLFYEDILDGIIYKPRKIYLVQNVQIFFW